MKLLFIVGLLLVVYLSLRAIIKSFYRSENYYEYTKNEMNAKCNYEDYVFLTRKLGK